MDQRDACGLVLNKDQVNALLVFALTVDHVVLLDHLGAQVWVLQAVLPAVDHHGRHWAVEWLEHTERDGGCRIVDSLLRAGAVVALQDVLELGERLVWRPQLEHVALDDP